MAAEKPRNRIVVFRLTQDEFMTLKTACAERGGRNLSDFTRSELLSFIHAQSIGGLITRRMDEMERRLSDLQRIVERMAGTLEDRNHGGEISEPAGGLEELDAATLQR